MLHDLELKLISSMSFLREIYQVLKWEDIFIKLQSETKKDCHFLMYYLITQVYV